MAIWNQSTWSITFDRSFLTFGTFIKALALSYFQFWTGNNLCDLWSYTYCGKSLKSIRSNWIVINRSKIILKFSCWINRHALLFISDGMFIRIDLIDLSPRSLLIDGAKTLVPFFNFLPFSRNKTMPTHIGALYSNYCYAPRFCFSFRCFYSVGAEEKFQINFARVDLHLLFGAEDDFPVYPQFFLNCKY